MVTETSAPDVNGVANTLGYLCQSLVRCGCRVTLIRPRPDPDKRAAGELAGLEVREVAGLSLPFYPEVKVGWPAGGFLSRLWRKERPDAVYIATQGPLGRSALNAARRLGVPVSAGFHTNFHQYCRYYGFGFLQPVVTAWLRSFHNRAERTLVPTRAVLNHVEELGIERCAIWSRGVDCTRFDPRHRSHALRRSWGVGADDLAILYVGRLAPEKNLDQAVRTFEAIRSLCPRARFVLVGDGPMRPGLVQTHPDYAFCGTRLGAELAAHYASGDLLLFPSKTDTFGNVVLEAMASGVPVAAYRTGAAAEYIEPKVNGMTVDLEDDSAYIRAALRLAEQDAFRTRQGAEARHTALTLDWGQRAEEFSRLLLKPEPGESAYVPA